MTRDTDSGLSVEPSTTRRRLLGGAAALATIPTAAEATEKTDEVDVQETDAAFRKEPVSVQDATSDVFASFQNGPVSGMFEDSEFDQLEFEIWRDYDGVMFDIEAIGDDGTRVGALLTLDQDTVSDLIKALQEFEDL